MRCYNPQRSRTLSDIILGDDEVSPTSPREIFPTTVETGGTSLSPEIVDARRAMELAYETTPIYAQNGELGATALGSDEYVRGAHSPELSTEIQALRLALGRGQALVSLRSNTLGKDDVAPAA